MDGTETNSPSLPLIALLPLVIIGAIIIGLIYRRTPSTAGRFVVVAIGLRPLLSALHQFTFVVTPVGLSINALASVAMAGSGLFVLRRRSMLSTPFLITYPMLAVMIVSGVLNGSVPSMVTAVTKIIYFIVLALAIVDACQDIGVDSVLANILPSLTFPLALQLIGLPFGIVKTTESAEGSASYIGGYNHEAAFSTLLIATLLVICFRERTGLRTRYLLVAWCFIGIILANYRTTILAALPLVGYSLLVDTARTFVARQRAIVIGLMMIVVGTIGLGVGVVASERFADVTVVLQQGSNLIKPPETFSQEESRLLSGRAVIWSQYLYAYADGGPLQHMIGFGPESWTKVFHLYAHNTIVSSIYEIGIFGLASLLIMWIGFFALCLKARPPYRSRLVIAHIAFFLLNMATMPMWLIEGMICYAILCGITLYAAAIPGSTHSIASDTPNFRNKPVGPSTLPI